MMYGEVFQRSNRRILPKRRVRRDVKQALKYCERIKPVSALVQRAFGRCEREKSHRELHSGVSALNKVGADVSARYSL